MAKWKCEICGNEFDNFHAQGFDNKIYCPLCYFKKENQELKKQLTTYQILHRDCNIDNLKNISKIEEKETQQKEFIKYLEDESKKIYRDFGLRQNIFRQILQKYKEIIGDDK